MTAAVHDDLVALVRDFTHRELSARAAALDAGRPGVIAEVWQHLVELDLDRALLSEDLGGVGLDVEDFLCVLAEVAVGDAGVALAVLLNNVAVASLPAEVAGGLRAGERWTLAFAPGADEPTDEGVDVTGAVGTVRMSGRLAVVFGAVDADGVVVATREPEPAVFAVRTSTAGLTVRPDPLQMGLRAARSANLIFDGAEVSVAAGPGSGNAESQARSLVRCGVAAMSRGIARRAHEIALTYAHTRIQGGKPIVEHGAVSDMLAEMAVRLCSRATGQLGAAANDPAAALAHKIAASDAAMATTLDAVQVLGGMGYMVDTGVEKLMRDAKYCQLYPERNWLGRNELMRLDPRSLRCL